jgi:hypothetical protein
VDHLAIVRDSVAATSDLTGHAQNPGTGAGLAGTGPLDKSGGRVRGDWSYMT